jgi:hypothetical protein
MKVLVACEESQVVCNAFRAKGHEAYSCDIIPTRGNHPEWHILEDVLNHLTDGWDMVIGFPECRYLANSGVRWISKMPSRMQNVKEASGFFYKLWNSDIPKICLENPIPHKYAELPQYSQIIHPWMFGHMEQKPTCLWLKGLPKLAETNNVKEEMLKLPANVRQRVHYMAPSEHRARDRAVTYMGIADAMADQWGKVAGI